MKNSILISFIASLFSIITIVEISAQEKTQYNAQLAKELNADEYGMKKYVMAFLKSGSNRGQDSITKSKLQKAHMENITKMVSDGTLSIAGPFFDDGEIRGIYIFNVDSIEEAKKITETDPLIQSGGLVMELHLWYGSAALQEVSKIHATITKKNH